MRQKIKFKRKEGKKEYQVIKVRKDSGGKWRELSEIRPREETTSET